MTWVYRTESKGIQSWILSTDRLRDLLGGSNRVETLVDHAKRMIGDRKGTTVMAAAGGVTARFEDVEGLRAFASEWPMFAARFAPGLPVVQAWVEEGGDRCGQLLADRLAEARNRAMPRIPEPGPLVLRSGRSGEPAVERGGRRGTSDAAMVAKARASAGTDGGEDRIARRLGKAGLARPAFLRADREEGSEFEEGTVAVVHMDGNGVGQMVIDLLSSPTGGVERLERFSKALSAATERAVASALSATIASADRRATDGRIRARPIVLGGDDVTFLVRGADALSFTRALLQSFKTETAAAGLADDGLTACAGVAIVKAHWPFHDAHALAEQLCKAAKSELKGADGRDSRSGLAFHRVTTALARDWDEIVSDELSAPRPEAYQDRPRHPAEARPDDRWVLTANPYDIQGLQRLESLTLALRYLRVPRGSLRRWVDLSRLDRLAAQRHWDRLGEVASERSHEDYQSWCKELREMEVDPKTGWRPDPEGGNRGRTPIPDVIEWTATLHNERRRGARA